MDLSAQCYSVSTLAQLPRLLSSGDRESRSLTYGCFDRSFWAWKFTDFAGARFQEAAYALAHLYRAQWANPLQGHANALAWSQAAMRYWRRLQHADGSFDEAYPFEHSFAATAFTGFYVGEAFELIADELPTPERDALTTTFARAGDWLCRNDEWHGVLSNHLAAAAAALVVIERITGDRRYGARSRHFLGRIYDRQSIEGWYEEYGGADPGYQSHGTFYLARIWQLTGDATLLESLARSVRFLKHFIHPNGTIGGEYGSRNTEFFFPAGFEILASVVPDAAAIINLMRPAVARSHHAGLAMMDRYNLLPMLNNYLFADAAARNTKLPAKTSSMPCEEEGQWSFADAGLLVRSTTAYFAVVGLSKGGVVKAYDRRTKRLVASDCGYLVRLADGRLLSSQSLTRPARGAVSGHVVELDCDFVQLNQRVMSPWSFMAFRLFSLTFGRLQAVARLVKQLLVHVLVTRRRAMGISLHRTVVLDAARITIEDQLTNPSQLRIAEVAVDEKFATIHMGSSRYFQNQELSLGGPEVLQGATESLADGRPFTRSRSWCFD